MTQARISRASEPPSPTAGYDELIEWLESHPENRSGADKSWVEKATREYREHYRRARRVR